MQERRKNFLPPRLTVLRWLAYPGQGVTREIGAFLLQELFTSPFAVVAAVICSISFDVIALALHAGGLFVFFIMIEAALVILRILQSQQAARNTRRGQSTQTDLYFLWGICWSAVEGAMVFYAMRTGITTLQILAASIGMGLLGPVCARNYPAPRYAILVVMLRFLPLVAGAGLSGNPWLLILIAQVPFYLFSVQKIISCNHGMALAVLKAERKSFDQARNDVLTGLLNRFGLTELVDDYNRTNTCALTVFYLDLDGFKPINDMYGHPTGDKILELVAMRLKSTIRNRDTLARLGGDEFVVVAKNMAPDQAGRHGEAFIRAVSQNAFVLPGLPPLHVGLSVGFACSPMDGATCADLQRHADEALYEAKRAGRGVHRRFQSKVQVPSDSCSSMAIAV